MILLRIQINNARNSACRLLSVGFDKQEFLNLALDIKSCFKPWPEDPELKSKNKVVNLNK